MNRMSQHVYSRLAGWLAGRLGKGIMNYVHAALRLASEPCTAFTQNTPISTGQSTDIGSAFNDAEEVTNRIV